MPKPKKHFTLIQSSLRASPFMMSKWKITVNFTFHVWRRLESEKRGNGQGAKKTRITLTIILAQPGPLHLLRRHLSLSKLNCLSIKRAIRLKNEKSWSWKWRRGEKMRNDGERWDGNWDVLRERFCMTYATGCNEAWNGRSATVQVMQSHTHSS